MAHYAENGQASSEQGNKRLHQTQAQVDEVMNIMKTNVEKVIERDAKITELDARAEGLQEGAAAFETSAKRLKRKFWWENLKMWLILIAIVVVIIIIIIVAIVLNVPKDNSESTSPKPTPT